MTFSATVTKTGDGGSGTYWYNWTIDTETSGNSANNTYTYTVPTDIQNAKKVYVIVKVTDQNDEELTASATNEMWQVQVTLQGVEAADELFVEEGQTYYATARSDAANVTVSLQVQPENANLPNDFIGWSGGQSTGNQLQRVLSRSTLQNDGVEIRATNNENTLFNSRIFVFQEKPEITDAIIVAELERCYNLCPGSGFGIYQREFFPSESTYVVYYENKNWNFELTEVIFHNRWNMHNLGRVDVPGDFTPFPVFPLGYNMNDPIFTVICVANTHYIARRERAKQDLWPDNTSEPRPPRDHYWASHLTQRHEKFHHDDWRGLKNTKWLPNAISNAEMKIRNEKVPLSITTLCPQFVSVIKGHQLRQHIFDETWAANLEFIKQAEERAYQDGKIPYQNLSNAIRFPN